MNKEEFIEHLRKAAIVMELVVGAFLTIIRGLTATEHKLSVIIGCGIGVGILIILTESKLFDIIVGKLYDKRFN